MQLIFKICNRWLFYGVSEMVTQLEWLRDMLIEAENSNEKVHIIGKFTCSISVGKIDDKF